ncbi:MAG: excinuclease ABC subunit UvrC [Candidatus Omnitrophica bacterium]|nr:excinuclease ABC subunit UvrC [Candidatus Omnitrophota bacterium]
MGKVQDLREKILAAPDSPGVYLMRDSAGEVLYVGKANSLKKRLFSYLANNLDAKTSALISKTAGLEFKLSANEAMALLLEAGLIHELKPRYNISLKDDKSFPLVKISNEEFPAISITRRKNGAAGRYLGPYTNAKLLKNALKIIRHSFGYRSCRRLPKQSCIYYRINLCPAPCIGGISAKEYKALIDKIIFVLEGRTDLLIRKLNKSMQDKSRAHDFEAAARRRDQIIVLSEMSASPGRFTRQGELEDLKNRLGLENLPERIEGFDISNISGKQAVGSMVSFQNGIADKNNYRRFRIKGFSGINDYKMLAEVVTRRYSRLAREKAALPDLLLIDGGRGHLLAASSELRKLNLTIPLVSIAKEKENIYSSTKSGVLVFPKDTPAINLIRRIRDEAHRFALSYHRILRKKEIFKKC